ncbi:hypothetical protein LXL04_007059 [Taraxacum kok-saghyz]
MLDNITYKAATDDVSEIEDEIEKINQISVQFWGPDQTCEAAVGVFLCKCFKWLFTEEDLTVFCVCFVWREEDLTVPLQVISLHPRSIRELIPQSSNGESDQISRLCKARAEEIHQLSRHLKWNRRSVQAWRRK